MQVGAARLEDRLSPEEPPYKSRGEAQVGRLLDRYGIPFFYEAPLVLHDRGQYRTWHPDFTLPTYGGLIIEYAGMPDRPEYLAGIVHKQAAYRRNGVPALFVYPQDLAGPTWPQTIMGRVVKAYPQSAPPANRAAPRFGYSFSHAATRLRPYGPARRRY